MTLKEAESYIHEGIRYGAFSEEIFEGMTDEEKIAFAKYEGERGDAALDAYLKGEE